MKKKVLQNQTLVGQVIGPKGTHSVINLRIDFMDNNDTRTVLDEIRKIAQKHQAEGFSISVTGMPAINTTLNEKMARDFLVLGWVALLIMTVIVAFLFRHPVGVIGPILAVFQSTTWMQGIMAICGVPMTMVTNVLPAFLFQLLTTDGARNNLFTLFDQGDSDGTGLRFSYLSMKSSRMRLVMLPVCMATSSPSGVYR